MDQLVAAAAIVIVAWFAGGTIANVRKGRALMRWMQAGLPAMGSRTTVRWLGSTAVELVIGGARPPFTAATVVIFLEARDLPWMWALGRSRGRRDMLIVRGQLRRAPAAELEAFAPQSWSAREARLRVPGHWQVRGTATSAAHAIHHADATGLALACALLDIAGRAGLDVFRLSVRGAVPHFQLHVALPDGRQSARDCFAAVRAMAERALD